MTAEPLTDIAAVCAIASPLWLHTLSDGAQFVLPFLGILWLLMQMAFKVGPLILKLRKKN